MRSTQLTLPACRSGIGSDADKNGDTFDNLADLTPEQAMIKQGKYNWMAVDVALAMALATTGGETTGLEFSQLHC